MTQWHREFCVANQTVLTRREMQSGSRTPQPTPTSLPPAMMATQAELEAAVAALPAKRRRLREAFDRLVACSPVPAPFRWEDLDAHLAAVAACFGHFELDFPHAAAAEAAAAVGPATAHNLVEHHLEKEEEEVVVVVEGLERRGERGAWEEEGVQGSNAEHQAVAAADAGPTTAHNLVEHQLEEEQQHDRERRGERGAWEEEEGSNAEQGEEARNASLELERAEEEGEVREAPSARPDREGDEAGDESVEAVAIVASPEQGGEEAMGATMASPRRSEGDIEMMEEEEEEAANASADQDGGEDEAEEGELPRPRTSAAATAPTRAAAAACAGMDPSALVDLLCVSGKGSLRARRELLPALLGAADPHALIVRAVGGFLALSGRRTNTCWGNCVALIECAPRLAAPAAAGALEEAGWVARDWKEMVVGKPWSCRDIGRMAGWGLLVFLASYNIVLEFDAEEITRLFDNVASQMKNNCVELCKRLGLIEKMTDLINHFIENGQPLDAIRLARTFNLTHKYPPLTIMNDYMENAKKTAEDILSKESYTLESLNQVVAKKINALIYSWSAIDGCNIDPVNRNTIKTEITHLLHKYANKQQSLAGVSAIISSTHQQLQMPLEEQRRRTLQELQQMPEEEQQHQQQKPHEMQQRHPQYRREVQQQHPQNRQEQEWMWQNRKGRKQNNKNCKRKQRRQKQQELKKRPRLSLYVRPGIHNQCSQSFSGMGRAPFAARTRPPPYFGPYDRSQP